MHDVPTKVEPDLQTEHPEAEHSLQKFEHTVQVDPVKR